MILYAVIMFAAAAMFSLVSALIYRGKTELIHDYHQKKVKDKTGYGKAFGKAMGVIAIAMALSGIIALFGEAVIWIATAALLTGLTVGIVLIVRVQREYNGGIF